MDLVAVIGRVLNGARQVIDNGVLQHGGGVGRSL